MLVGAFALLALTLALVGVFGVLAYSVQQRTREFGVRIALGASAASVLRLVMSSAGGVIGAGVAIGLVSRPLLSRSITTFLFGVQPLDPMTFLAGAGGAHRDRGDRRRRSSVARGTGRSGGGVSK